MLLHYLRQPQVLYHMMQQPEYSHPCESDSIPSLSKNQHKMDQFLKQDQNDG